MIAAEDGTIPISTIDGNEVVADNIDTITLERIKANTNVEHVQNDTFMVTLSTNGQRVGPVEVSAYTYAMLRDLEHKRAKEVNAQGDTLE
ncbi:MAG: hypothetical protein ACREGE_04390 [Candidatus Microsaccharimonas sp.]